MLANLFFPLLSCAAALGLLGCGDDTSTPSDAGIDVPGMIDTGASDVPQADNAGDGGACTPPTHLKFTVVARNTRNDLGWSGLVHDIGVNDRAEFTVRVIDCDDDCNRCRIEGPVDGSGIDTQRCTADTTILCESDGDCPGGQNFCRYILGPPLSTFRVGGPQCATVYLEPTADGGPAIEGVIDLRDGRTTMEITRFASANNRSGGGCAVCQNDPVPGDGNAQGTCEPSSLALEDPTPQLGMDCDTHGFGLKVEGSYSFDCSVSTTAPIFSFFLDGFSTSGQEWVMDDTRPDCTNPETADEYSCWCGICEGTLRDTCTADSDCGAGVGCGWLPGVCSEASAASGTEGWATPCVSEDDCSGAATCVNDVWIRGCAAGPGAGMGCCDDQLGGDCSLTPWPNCTEVCPAPIPKVGYLGAPVPTGGPAPASPSGAANSASFCGTGECVWDGSQGSCAGDFTTGGAAHGCYPNNDGVSIQAPGANRVVDDAYTVRMGALNCIPPTYIATSDFSLGLPGPGLYTGEYLVEKEFRVEE